MHFGALSLHGCLSGALHPRFSGAPIYLLRRVRSRISGFTPRCSGIELGCKSCGRHSGARQYTATQVAQLSTSVGPNIRKKAHASQEAAIGDPLISPEMNLNTTDDAAVSRPSVPRGMQLLTPHAARRTLAGTSTVRFRDSRPPHVRTRASLPYTHEHRPEPSVKCDPEMTTALPSGFPKPGASESPPSDLAQARQSTQPGDHADTQVPMRSSPSGVKAPPPSTPSSRRSSRVLLSSKLTRTPPPLVTMDSEVESINDTHGGKVRK